MAGQPRTEEGGHLRVSRKTADTAGSGVVHQAWTIRGEPKDVEPISLLPLLFLLCAGICSFTCPKLLTIPLFLGDCRAFYALKPPKFVQSTCRIALARASGLREWVPRL